MTTRDDITIEWLLSPRIVKVASPSVEITIQDLVDTLRPIEYSFRGMSEPYLISAAGKEDLGGGVKVGITANLQNSQLSFDARTANLEKGFISSEDTTGVTLTDIDSSTDFIASGVGRGDLVYNHTDESKATVLSVTDSDNLVTDGLTGGTDNQWNVSDHYEVYDVEQCNIAGGNLVATDTVGASLDPVFPSFGTQIIRVSSSSATLQELSAIQFASFNAGITVDVTSPYSGTTFPVGTSEQPVNNVSDAIIIGNSRGLKKLFIMGDITLTTGHDLAGWIIEGETSDKSTITVDSGADVQGSEFLNATIIGTLDGETAIDSCFLGGLAFTEGTIKNCMLGIDPIILGGSNDTHFLNCYSGVAGNDSPTIDLGSGRDVSFRGYSGGLKLINFTGGDNCSVDFIAGQCIIDPTCTAGTITIRGVARLLDRSGSGCSVNTDGIINKNLIRDVRNSVELLRDHHVSSGDTYYWDPVNGDDIINDGITDKAAKKTFAATQELCQDGHHDTIFAVPGQPGNETVTTEICVLSKNYTFLRSTGRDFQFTPDTDTSPTITITGNGCQIEKMVVNTKVGSGVTPQPAIKIDGSVSGKGNFAFLHGVWIDQSSYHGVEMNDSSASVIKNLMIEGVEGDGIYLGDNINFMTIKGDVHISNCLGDGVNLAGSSVEEVRLIGHCEIEHNQGHGIRIGAGALDTHIHPSTVMLNGNVLGDLLDNGTDTDYGDGLFNSRVSDAIWDETIADHTSSGSTGEALDNVSAGASPAAIADAVWDEVSSGHLTDGTFGEIMQDIIQMKKLSENKAIITDELDGSQTIVVFDDDDVTPIHTYTLSADKLERVPA